MFFKQIDLWRFSTPHERPKSMELHAKSKTVYAFSVFFRKVDKTATANLIHYYEPVTQRSFSLCGNDSGIHCNIECH